jgi:DNA-binding MarR family transcriptional regulator
MTKSTNKESRAMAGDEVLEQLSTLMFRFRAELRRDIVDAGHPVNGMEVRILSQIARMPACTAMDLVRSNGRDKAQIARILQQLEQNGLVTRAPDEQDRRQQRLSLSGAGKSLVTALHRARRNVGRRLLAALSVEEQQQLGQLLTKLRMEE